MVILLAVGAAIGWGASDYFGGDASRRDTPVFVIVAVAELLGGVLLAPILIFRGTSLPADPRLLFAALAGVAVTVELSLIYRALARGQAFITAPIGALGASAAVTVGLVGGNPLDLSVAIGLACALSGGAISAWTTPTADASSADPAWQTAAICLGASAAVAIMLTTLHAAGRLDPVWSTATEHTSTAVSAGVAALLSTRGSRSKRLRVSIQMPRLALIATVGVGGDLAYTAASHRGAVSIVAAISSLYPVTTIALGRLLQRHCATRLQIVGSLVALFGAALLGAATR
ncbi:MAG: DMT family transporter [Solirubrobacteraceae bacterium]